MLFQLLLVIINIYSLAASFNKEGKRKTDNRWTEFIVTSNNYGNGKDGIYVRGQKPMVLHQAEFYQVKTDYQVR